MSRILKKIWNIATWMIIGIIVIIAVLLAGARLVGYSPYIVLSGSMEPAYHVGSLIYVERFDPQDIKIGDAITFNLNENTIVTHRIYEIDTENSRIITKGDANDDPDASPVKYENVIGKAVFTIPLLGYISAFITSPPGLYITIGFGIVFILLVLIIDAFFKQEKSDKNTKEEKVI